MPTNNYKCTSCSKEWKYIGPHQNRECPECKVSTEPSLPVDINTPSVFEVIDTGFAVKRRDNFEERAQKRNATGSKPAAKEIAREHGEDPKKHGISEDDARLI